MWYNINVAEKDDYTEKYEYLFNTDKIQDIRIARKVLRKLQKDFPEPKYKISISVYKTVGIYLDIDKFYENDDQVNQFLGA
jgi:hypothetical protein